VFAGPKNDRGLSADALKALLWVTQSRSLERI